MKKIVLLVSGFLLLSLAAAGIVIPILPSTPFVLAASGCFCASSPQIYQRLEKNRVFGDFIKHKKHRCGVSKAARHRALLFLWFTLALSLFICQSIFAVLVLWLVGIFVSLHILTIKAGKRNHSETAGKNFN